LPSVTERRLTLGDLVRTDFGTVGSHNRSLVLLVDHRSSQVIACAKFDLAFAQSRSTISIRQGIGRCSRNTCRRALWMALVGS
jgi:hypothetical protein